MEVETDGGFRISSNFDSGNLQRLEKVEPGTVTFEGQGPDDLCAHEFNCWVNPDCGGTEYENNNRTWFHFSFSGGPPFATVRFNIMNMNRQGKLYAQGMRTVYRVEPLFPEWKRLTDTHLYKVEDNNFIMSFKYYTLEDAGCTTYFAFSFPYSYTELQTHLNARDLQFRITPPIGIYYHRELLTYTLDGRRVDLLTITASDGGEGREHRLPGLFPLAQTEQRAVRFPGRKAAAGSDSESLVSSGETERSAWSASSVSSGKDEPPAVDSNLFLYMDMHGHASKRGCFMYGNHFSCDETMVDCMLLPKLVSLNSANFDFLACNFTEKNMHHRGKKDGLSKEGSGRVALYRATGLVRSYTLECNYNTGRFCNVLPPLPAEPEPPADTPLVFEPVPYTPAHYEQVGEALMISILDLTGDNPLSRLPRSEYRDTAGVRAWIKRFMTVTKFGENNILFSPEKTARTMKVTERHRQAAAEERSPGAGGRNVSSTPAGGTGAQRRLALGTTSPGRCGAETKDRRRPPLRRVRKAKKLSPGKVEDQENATVARPANKRSADALLAPSAAVKTDPEINLDKETAGPASQPSDLASPAGPSQLRVKSPVLQPRFGQQLTQTGNSPAGLSRKPVRRALSEKRKVLKPTPVKLGESGLQTGAAPKLRRSGSLVNAASADAPLAETSVVNNLNLILGDKRQVAGLAPRMRRPSVKTRCSTRMAAKKSAKTLKVKRAVRPLADPAEPSTSAAGAAGESSAEKPAKAPRKKLARRASAPVGPDPLAALELMTSPGGSLAGDVTAALEAPPMRAKVRKPRVKSKPRSPGARSVSVSGGTHCSLTADQDIPDGPRRAVSEGHGSPEPGPALPPAAGRLLKKKQGKLARRTGLERGRPALQQVKKRKLKEKV
ncbi:Cytosolic carboxypeptidase-like protein 5 [Amphibalanus amphitrite]|uniref:Cytosolic carboxypeptidase-like protein 5 n=1 Tax=Amphibalanus amphitrite TaxID=1232801 RepID=A0A6A4VGF0_AMPAM|nr:Cytosolic carboxypeptidase-like protein 5 [Amphibalanus amphitrite]